MYEDLIGIEMDDIDFLGMVYKCLLDNSRTGFLVERYTGSDDTEYCYSCFDASEGVSHNLSLLEMDKRDEMKKDSYWIVMSWPGSSQVALFDYLEHYLVNYTEVGFDIYSLVGEVNGYCNFVEVYDCQDSLEPLYYLAMNVGSFVAEVDNCLHSLNPEKIYSLFDNQDNSYLV